MGIAAVSLLGYMYGVEALYAVREHKPISLLTVFGFLVLGAGILCARPDRGVVSVIAGDHAGGVLARALLPAAILVPAALGWLRVVANGRGFSAPKWPWPSRWCSPCSCSRRSSRSRPARWRAPIVPGSAASAAWRPST